MNVARLRVFMPKKIFSVTLLAAFLLWTGWYVANNVEAFRPVLEVTKTDALILALAFMAIMLGNGLFIAVVSHAFGIRLVSPEWFSLSFASSFANYFLPFRGGTGVRALYMNRVHDLPITDFVSTLGIMYLMHVVVNGLMALAGMGLIARNGGTVNLILAAFFALVALSGLAAILVRFEIRRQFQRFPLVQIARLVNAWQSVRADRSLVVKLWLLMFAMTAVTVLQCRAAFDAVAVSLSWEGVLVYAASKNLGALIGLTPGSLGVVELISIYLGNVLGYSTADALSVQALIRAVAIASLLSVGPVAIFYLRRRLGSVSAAAAGAPNA